MHGDETLKGERSETVDELLELVLVVQKMGRRLAYETHGESYDFVRDLNANVWMHDLHRIESAASDAKTAAAWGESLDRILRSNLMVNGHPDALVIYAKKGEDPAILANGQPVTFGVFFTRCQASSDISISTRM